MGFVPALCPASGPFCVDIGSRRLAVITTTYFPPELTKSLGLLRIFVFDLSIPRVSNLIMVTFVHLKSTGANKYSA